MFIIEEQKYYILFIVKERFNVIVIILFLAKILSIAVFREDYPSTKMLLSCY